MAASCRGGWAYFDPDYEYLSATLYPPDVSIDNEKYPDETVISVDSKNRHGILLEILQVLVDSSLVIKKFYVTTDGEWFIDVFHVTSSRGEKIKDLKLLKRLQELLEKKTGVLPKNLDLKSTFYSSEMNTSRVSLGTVDGQTTIELAGPARHGFLFDVFLALKDLNCNLSSVEAWTHNSRIACMIILDKSSEAETPWTWPAHGQERLSVIKSRLCEIVLGEGTSTSESGRIDIFGPTHKERRLHQMMSADEEESQSSSSGDTLVTVQNLDELNYTVVTVDCENRSKLAFDTICTLTDMDYEIFHADGHAEGLLAVQEFHIRRMDGRVLETQAERDRLVKHLQAAIERRLPVGLRLELCTYDRIGLVSDIVRVFYQYGLTVTRAYMTVQNGKAYNTFYFWDESGHPISEETMEDIRSRFGEALQIEDLNDLLVQGGLDSPPQKFSVSSFFKSPGQLMSSLYDRWK